VERESQCLFRSSGEPRDGWDWNRTIFNPSARSLPCPRCWFGRVPLAAYCKSNSICARYPRNPSAWHLASYRKPRRIPPAAIYFGQQIARNSSISRVDRPSDRESKVLAAGEMWSTEKYSPVLPAIQQHRIVRHSRYICIIKEVHISYILMTVVCKPFQIPILKRFGKRIAHTKSFWHVFSFVSSF